MGFIGGLVGSAGGQSGTGVGGPKGGTVMNPVTDRMARSAYKGVQAGMGQQNDLLTALQGQQGLANQSSVYNQYQGIANGTGPNPAKAMLSNATGQNVAAQAALMAGQRGSGSNAGLMARQAAMQGANTQQQGIGQAANMQAQQSLNALGQMGTVANSQVANQIGQTNANTASQQAEQANLFNAINGVNANSVGMQSNINNVNGQLANTTMQGQHGLMGGLMNMAGGMMGGMMGGAQGGAVPRYAEGDMVEQSAPMPAPVEAAPVDETVEVQAPEADFGDFGNAQVTAPAVNISTPTFGTDAAAAEMGKAGKKEGGGGGGMGGMMKMFAMLAEGGAVTDPNGPKSKAGRALKGAAKALATKPEETPQFGNPGANALYKGMSSLGDGINKYMNAPGPAAPQTSAQPVRYTSPGLAEGGKVPAMVSPGEQYLKPSEAQAVKKGANPLSIGERIPGKPKYKGNNYANDTVPKTLEAGGVVIPNSIMQSKNASAKAAKFVEAVLSKNRGLKK